MKTSMTFTGDRELARALADLSTRVSKSVARQALAEGAEPIRAQGERYAPRRAPKPDLADHIVISTQRAENRESAAVKVGPSTGFFYGFFQEFGTAHHAAHPFMRPALSSKWRESLDIVKDAFWRVLASRGVIRTGSAPSGPVGGPGGSLT